MFTGIRRQHLDHWVRCGKALLTRRRASGWLIARLVSLILGCGATTSHAATPGIAVTKYRGPGFFISYPSYWSREASDKAVALKVPTQAGQIFFSIGPIASTRDQAFNDVRTQYPSIAIGSPEPTIYGAWRGDSITGYFTLNGQPWVMSMTAIEANDTFYGLIMIAPSQVKWDAFKLREALGNTLTFDRLPSQSRGQTGACSDCGAMLGATMNTLTSQTLSMMK